MLPLLLALAASWLPDPQLPAATVIATDPPRDAAAPAAMEVLHIPSGDGEVNGVAYVPAGRGPHPVLLLLHGLPGNEKNLDLAQAARRAGWVAVTMNYRGSWGSPGRFSFANVLADADAALAYLRRPEVAARLRADPRRLVLAGHSMGGWATAHVAAHDSALAGAILISAADLDADARGVARDRLAAGLADNHETLTTPPAALADELRARAPTHDFTRLAPALARTPLLVLSSDDGNAPATDALAAGARRAGNARVTARHVATDHGWSDRRIALQTLVIDWLARLR
jgi:pimeloyl-ACP methyl ester carboxylesterase